MRYPPRLSHLVTRPVVVTKLAPTCAVASNIDAEDSVLRLERALKGSLHDDLLAACWQALTAVAPKPADDELLDTIAAALKKRGERAGKVASITPGWDAFAVLVNVRAAAASEAAEALLRSEEGAKRAAAGVVEAARHLAAEVTRK